MHERYRAVCLALVVLLAACGRGKPEAAAPPPAALTYSFIAGPMDEMDGQMLAAAESGDAAQIEQAIAAGGNVNAADRIKRTPLFAAAFRNHPDVVRLLAGKGANVNAKDTVGMAPLHAAVAIGGTEAVAALLDAGADINSRNAAGQTPLHLAAATDQRGIVALLLQRGASTRIRDGAGLTPAALATESGHPDVAKRIGAAAPHPPSGRASSAPPPS